MSSDKSFSEKRNVSMKSVKLAMSAVAAVALCVGTALATDDVAASAFSDDSFLIDTCLDGIQSSGTTNLTYSVFWHGDSNSVVMVAQNGVTIAGPLHNEGNLPWKVDYSGPYTLSLYTINANGSTNQNVETASFDVKGLPYQPIGRALGGFDGEYDGQGHGVTVTVTNPVAGASVKYAVGNVANGLSDTAPVFTNVCNTKVYVVISADNYATETNELVVTIRQAENGWTTDQPSIEGWTYGETANQANLGTPKFGTSSVTYSSQTLENAGDYTATFVVPGTENYKGLTNEVSFSIAPALIESDMQGFDVDYDGEGHSVVLSVTKPASGATVKYSVGDVPGSWSDEAPVFTNVCDTTVWAEITAANYVTATNSADVLIAKATNGWVTVPSVDDWTYGETAGQANLGAPMFGTSSVTYSSQTLEDAGCYTATFVVEGTDNYEGLTNEVTFSIAPAVIVSDMQGFDVAYDGAGHNIQLTVTKPASGATVRYSVGDVPGSWSDEAPAFTNVCDTTVWAEISAANYVTATSSVAVKIAMATNEWAEAPSINGWTYGEEASVPSMGQTKFGTAEVTYSDTPGNAGDYTARFVVKGTENYYGLTNEVPFTIAPAAIEAEMSGSEVVYDGAGHGVTVTVAKPAAGATVRYSVGDAPGSWVDEAPVFTNVCDETVWAEISATNFVTTTNSATVKITKATYDMSGVAWNYVEPFEYDGSDKTVELTGLPDGVTAEYTNAVASAAGSYTAHATLIYDEVNYEEPTVGDLEWEIEASEPGPLPPGPGPLPPQPQPQTKRVLWYADTPFVPGAATVWNGYLMDTNGVVAGTIQAKVGRPGRKNPTMLVSVTVKLAGGARRLTYSKRMAFDGLVDATMRDGSSLSLKLGAESLSGTFGGYDLDGSRNVFLARDAESKARAAALNATWVGSYVATWPGVVGGWNGLSVKIGNRGRARAIGRTSTGARFTVFTQLMQGERECAIAVGWTGRNSSAASLLWFCEDGKTVECESRPNGIAAQVSEFSGGVAPNSQFRVGVAGIVPSDLKLRFSNWKEGYTGCFYVYVQDGKKIRRLRSTVSGVVVDGKGYGTAIIPGIGAVPVTIE